MFKIILYIIIFSVFAGGAASLYHLYNVYQKNSKELSNFEKSVAINNNLGKVLVVYYSLSGHTKNIALQIAQKTGADIYEIKTKEEYTSPSVYIESKKQLMQKKYPALKGFLPDLSAYDVVFVGGPVWWYTMAPALYSFLKAVDFKGKRVASFSTQGSNYGSFFEDFQKTAQNAKFLKSENFNNVSEKYNNQVSNKINQWINEL